MMKAMMKGIDGGISVDRDRVLPTNIINNRPMTYPYNLQNTIVDAMRYRVSSSIYDDVKVLLRVIPSSVRVPSNYVNRYTRVLIFQFACKLM